MHKHCPNCGWLLFAGGICGNQECGVSREQFSSARQALRTRRFSRKRRQGPPAPDYLPSGSPHPATGHKMTEESRAARPPARVTREQAERVKAALRAEGPLTMDGMSVATGMPINTITWVVHHLRDEEGAIEKLNRHGRTRSNRKAMLYGLTGTEDVSPVAVQPTIEVNS